MELLNKLPPVMGVTLVVTLMAQKLMDGPYIFRSPFWDGDIKIETIIDYRAWVRTVERIGKEFGAEQNAKGMWEMERNKKFEEGQWESVSRGLSASGCA